MLSCRCGRLFVLFVPPPSVPVEAIVSYIVTPAVDTCVVLWYAAHTCVRSTIQWGARIVS